jgi:hypothetical protein
LFVNKMKDLGQFLLEAGMRNLNDRAKRIHH